MLALRVAGALPPLYERSRCSLLCSHSESFVSWILAFDAQGQGTFLSVTATIVVHCFVCLFFNAKQKESGHLSYACPKNMLGEREPPKKKEKKKKRKLPEPEEEIEEVEVSEEEGEDPALDSLSQAIAFQQAKIEEEQSKWRPNPGGPSTSDDSRRPRIKKSAYFSDEEELSD